MLPPILSTSILQMQRPRPVPPYFRVTLGLAWLNARNRRGMASDGIPQPAHGDIIPVVQVANNGIADMIMIFVWMIVQERYERQW